MFRVIILLKVFKIISISWIFFIKSISRNYLLNYFQRLLLFWKSYYLKISAWKVGIFQNCDSHFPHMFGEPHQKDQTSFSDYKSKQILFHFPQPNSPPQWTPFASNIKPRTPSIQEDGLKTTVPLPPASTPGGPQRLRSPLLLPSKPSQASRTMTSSPPWCRRLPSCSRAARSATASASTATPATRASPGLSARCSSTAAAPTSALLEATTSSICPTLFPATSLPTRT